MGDRAVDTRFIALNSNQLDWVDGADIQELPPPGPEVKVLRRFPDDDNALDLLVRFPPGYVEPRHTHGGEHMVFILEGTMLVDGKTLGPGDYVYGPRDEPHGPFEYPDGILLYASHRGDVVHHYEGKAPRADSEVGAAGNGQPAAGDDAADWDGPTRKETDVHRA